MQHKRENTILLIGSGSMGKAIAHDLHHLKPYYNLIIFDRDPKALERMLRFLGDANNIETVFGEIRDPRLLRKYMKKSALTIGAAAYKYNFELTQLAISSGSSWIDLGGNNQIVDRQFRLNDSAVNAGVAIAPDCGLAPGLVSVIGKDAISKLEQVDELRLRVGGLPQKPEPPLFYALCFSVDGLINEYVEPARFIEDGQIKECSSLTGWERIYIGPPYGTMEAFNTSGGSSTMVDTFSGKVRNLDYKTIRYLGHLKRIRLLADLGLFGSDEIKIGSGLSTTPRRVMGAILNRLGWVKEDLVILKAWAIGAKNGRNGRIDYKMIDEYDPETNLTAMARTTGFSAAITARMILEGKIEAKGALKQELFAEPTEFFSELYKRGIEINISQV